MSGNGLSRRGLLAGAAALPFGAAARAEGGVFGMASDHLRPAPAKAVSSAVGSFSGWSHRPDVDQWRPRVIVRTHGGALPRWVEPALPTPARDGQPIEIDLVHAARLDGGTDRPPLRLPASASIFRFIIRDERLAESLAPPGAKSPFLFHIAAPADAVGTVAEALALWLARPTLIGLDLADLRWAFDPSQTGEARCRAAVVAGWPGRDGDERAATALHVLAEGGSNGGLLMMHLVTSERAAAYSLWESDEGFNYLRDHLDEAARLVVTVSLHASCDALLLVRGEGETVGASA